MLVLLVFMLGVGIEPSISLSLHFLTPAPTTKSTLISLIFTIYLNANIFSVVSVLINSAWKWIVFVLSKLADKFVIFLNNISPGIKLNGSNNSNELKPFQSLDLQLICTVCSFSCLKF